MIELQGIHNSAKVFATSLERPAMQQIYDLLNLDIAATGQIRFMPDCHAGAGTVIGTTMTFQDKIIPNMVGVDIACGMKLTRLNVAAHDLHLEDFQKLDRLIQSGIPTGPNVRTEPHQFAKDLESRLSELRCAEHVDLNRAGLSVGTLGGGNHFIELNRDNTGLVCLVIHTGSRNLGKQVCDYYQKLAQTKRTSTVARDIIEKLKAEGRHNEIQATLAQIQRHTIQPDRLAHLQGQDCYDYLHDMAILQEYADANRTAITHEILTGMGWTQIETFTTLHNYVDLEQNIIRKGAVSAKQAELLLIPLNMRDGSLICRGLGNPDWNYSAPHGAGRRMSRTEAREKLDLIEYTESMSSVYSSCVCSSTLDEAPDAYKPMEEILDAIKATVTVLERIVPIYNYKHKE